MRQEPEVSDRTSRHFMCSYVRFPPKLAVRVRPIPHIRGLRPKGPFDPAAVAL